VNLVTGVICYFLNSYFPGKLLGYSSWMQLKDISTSYGLAIIMALSVYFLKFLPVSYWLILPVQLCVGLLIGLLFCKIARMEEYTELKTMITPFLKKFKR